MEKMKHNKFETRLDDAQTTSENPYYQYLTEDKINKFLIKKYDNSPYTTDDIEWYYPDFFLYNKGEAHEIKKTQWIRRDKLNRWYPAVLFHLKSMGLKYYFVYDSGDKWYHFDMERLISKFRGNSEIFWKDSNHYPEHIYNIDKSTAYKIPLHLAEREIDKPAKYIWKSKK